MSWGPWIDSPPETLDPSDWTALGRALGVFSGYYGTGNDAPVQAELDTVTAAARAGTYPYGSGGTTDEWFYARGTPNNGITSGWDFLFCSWQDIQTWNLFSPHDYTYGSALGQTVMAFQITTVPTLVTYPTPSDSAVPGDPGTVGLLQYDAGTEVLAWSDFSITWANTGYGGQHGGATENLVGAFGSWLDLSYPGVPWFFPAPGGTTFFTVDDTHTTMSVAMSDFGLVDAIDFSIHLWPSGATAGNSLADLEMLGDTSAARQGGWTGLTGSLPVPQILRPRHRLWAGSGPNLNGDRGIDRIHFIPIRRRP